MKLKTATMAVIYLLIFHLLWSAGTTVWSLGAAKSAPLFVRVEWISLLLFHTALLVFFITLYRKQ